MRVTRLELTGVGPFEGAVFDIPEPTQGAGELVLFEGPNGSGKTTLLQTLALAASGQWSVGTQGWAEAPREEYQRRCHSSCALRVHVAPGLGLEASAIGPGVACPKGLLRDALDRFEAAVGDGRTAVDWVALSYGPDHPSASLATEGPKDLREPPLRGALAFGRKPVGSRDFGQLLTNLESERVRAAQYAQEQRSPADEQAGLLQTAVARRESLARFERVLSRMLDRAVKITFPIGQHAPRVTLDGQEIAIDLFGEGLRSTFSWLADLLVRLERIVWVDAARSPLDQSFWLILDEVELSLHPTMQAHLYPALRELLPNARIYATTHSPFVVASVGEGVVFPIRPDQDHKVRGPVEARVLTPGQSLEWVTTEIFQAGTGFIDQKTRDLLDEHRRDIRRFRRTGTMDWDAFFTRRSQLFALNDEVRVTVAMQEVPVRGEVDDHMLARAEGREQRDLGAGT
jgi:energy-coupling factor transporter ATP-binding protein EcfA2